MEPSQGRNVEMKSAEAVAAPARDPEKACPGLDPGWEPVSGKDHAQNNKLEWDAIRRKAISL
jgi:hypothetical protein